MFKISLAFDLAADVVTDASRGPIHSHAPIDIDNLGHNLPHASNPSDNLTRLINSSLRAVVISEKHNRLGHAISEPRQREHQPTFDVFSQFVTDFHTAGVQFPQHWMTPQSDLQNRLEFLCPARFVEPESKRPLQSPTEPGYR